MRTTSLLHGSLWFSPALAAMVLLGCTFDTQGQLAEDGGLGGSGGTAIEAGVDVDTPEIIEPEPTCFYPNRWCDGNRLCNDYEGGNCVCASIDDASYGCHPETCEPCPVLKNTEAICLNGACGVGECLPGFHSCDPDPDTGCETNIWSLENCGECGSPCSLPNTEEQVCNKGACEIVACKDNWDDCNNNHGDGCETQLRTVSDCTECFDLCQVEVGIEATCASGVCQVNNCPPGRADCNGDPTTCDTDITTPSNCGACGLVCSASNVTSWNCVDAGGTRQCQVAACVSDWGNCDGDHGTGCERDLRVSANHCGSCGFVCSNANVQNRTCSNGKCVPSCAQGFGDCGGLNSGCETSLTTTSNCGFCGNVCNLENAQQACISGFCGIAGCISPWDNCDGIVSNGCEANLHTTAAHCGGCGQGCSNYNIPTPLCSNGNCTGTCATGFADCNSNKRTDGCETNIASDVNNCGGCGNICSSNNIPTRTCTAGGCTGNCATGYADCNENKLTDGCEIDTRTNTSHCGACKTPCSSNHVTPNCSSGVCNGPCEAGWSDCNSNKQTDGCETNTSSDILNCGGCGQNCSSNNIPSPKCESGNCTGDCASGYSDCNDNKRTDGCETHTAEDVNNCGGCNNVCSSQNIPSRTCSNGVCTGACADGYADCNANKLTDGCETNLSTDNNHCGGCNSPCKAGFTCVGGNCECTTGSCGSGASCVAGKCVCPNATECDYNQVCNGNVCE